MKPIKLLLTLLALASGLNGMARYVTSVTIDGIAYDLYSGIAQEFPEYKCYATADGLRAGTPDELVIPEYITYKDVKYRVTDLYLESPIIANSINPPVTIKAPHVIKAYGFGATGEKSRLKTIEFGECLEFIGDLYAHPNLKTIKWYPSTIKEIKDNCFSGLNKLKPMPIRFGANLERIGIEVFKNCQGLKEVSFQNCTKLTEIPTGAFMGSSITYIHMPPNLQSIGYAAFKDCKNLFAGSLNGFTMPSTVKRIYTSAFENCTSLYWVDAKSCNELNLIDWDNIPCINIFKGCTRLHNVAIGGKSTEIGESMFSGCTNLEQVSIPETVVKIGKEAFMNCTKLKNRGGVFTLPMAIQTAGSKAFYGCESLRIIKYPLKENHIVYDEGDAFTGCERLENILPVPVKEEEKAAGTCSRAGSNDKYSQSGFRLQSSCPNLHASPYLMADSHIVETYYIPTNMTDVDYTSFSSSFKWGNSEYLKNCIFSSSTSRIGNNCIKDLYNVERVVFNAVSIEKEEDEETEPEETEPAELTIEAGAFSSNTKLARVECHHVTPPALSDDAFSATTYMEAKLIVPTESLSLYASSPGWKNFLSIESPDGHSSLSTVGTDMDDTPVYYDLQGIEVHNPRHGLYIVKRGSKVEKIIL